MGLQLYKGTPEFKDSKIGLSNLKQSTSRHGVFRQDLSKNAQLDIWITEKNKRGVLYWVFCIWLGNKSLWHLILCKAWRFQVQKFKDSLLGVEFQKFGSSCQSSRTRPRRGWQRRLPGLELLLSGAGPAWRWRPSRTPAPPSPRRRETGARWRGWRWERGQSWTWHTSLAPPHNLQYLYTLTDVN